MEYDIKKLRISRNKCSRFLMKKKLSDIQMHSAGAIIQHRGIFGDLPTYTNKVEITQDFRDKWVIPFYFNIYKNDQLWIDQMITIKEQITEEIIFKNLGDFNWRTRSTGAYFAAIKDSSTFTEIIGNHLLKSEVCFAGKQYAITLAYFNTNLSVNYLNRYLEYYLLQTDLDFDQIPVAASLKYLDEINNTNHFQNHVENFRNYKKYRAEKSEEALKKFTKEGGKEIENVFEGHVNFWKEELDVEPIRSAIDTIDKIRGKITYM